ncbi:hypothetical protein ACCD02_30990 [Pseudomonas sp. Pseusp88]|uniref:hypothetical protein n=1 Tax=Pseudomonas sp. Pseusp88 TaxID=3243061 RepID=UPI0039A68FDF
MAKMKILAGDLLEGTGEYFDGVLSIETLLFPWPGIKISTSQIRSIRVVGEELNKVVGNSMLQGLAGGLVLGPLGALTGFMLGKEQKDVTFLVTLKDGRTILAEIDEPSFLQIEEAVRRANRTQQ